jgi:hypothetical protein
MVQLRKLCGAGSLPLPYLQVPVDDPIGFKIIIILSKGVDELLCHLGNR